MQVKLKWNGDAVKKQIQAEKVKNVERAAITFQNEVKRAISEPSPPASEPGQPPHKDTGRLRASISREVDRAEPSARVGTNLPYGKWLELGTRKMAARSFLVSTFQRIQGRLLEIMKGS